MNTTTQSNTVQSGSSYPGISGSSVVHVKEWPEIRTDFTSLLVARFCHDISGSIGAINNGTDFIESEDADMRRVAVGLVKTSSHHAVNKLVFLRQAYGFIADNKDVPLHTVEALSKNFLKETKVNAEILKESKVGVIGHKKARLIYNLIIVVSIIMLKSGDLNIVVQNDSNITATTSANGHRFPQEFKNLLVGDEKVGLTTHNIQFAFLYLLTRDLGYQIEVLRDDPTSVSITIKKILDE